MTEPAATEEHPRAMPGIDDMLCFSLYSAQHAFGRVYKPLLESLGLTYPQYLVMSLLWAQDGQTVGALGNSLGLDSGTLTPLLKRLEQAGLVARQRAKADERQVEAHLTAAGHALRAKAQDVPACIFAATGMSLEQLDALKAQIGQLRANLLAASEAV